MMKRRRGGAGGAGVVIGVEREMESDGGDIAARNEILGEDIGVAKDMGAIRRNDDTGQNGIEAGVWRGERDGETTEMDKEMEGTGDEMRAESHGAGITSAVKVRDRQDEAIKWQENKKINI